MNKLNLNPDSDSIDFDFFDEEGDRIKMYDQCTNNNSSKIITKAVIETKPIEMVLTKQMSNCAHKASKSNTETNKVNLVKHEINDDLCSPTSSEERRLLSTPVEDMPKLFNCLAFSDSCTINEKKPIFDFMDDKYSSDNSLSDSTVTTITSDFTSVSHLSSVSGSSYESDLSADSPDPENTGSKTNYVGNLNGPSLISSSDLSEHLKVPDTNIPPKNVVNGTDTDNCDEITDTEYEVQRTDGNDGETQEINKILDESFDKRDSNEKRADIEFRKKLLNCKIEKSKLNQNQCQHKNSLSISSLEEGLGDVSLTSRSNSNSSIAKHHTFGSHNKFRTKRRGFNLTFSREELIKIERDNTILLKKIMSYSKPRSVSLNHPFSHKKTSAAINRERQQKKIEQDNYILYSKISAMSRMKKVF